MARPNCFMGMIASLSDAIGKKNSIVRKLEQHEKNNTLRNWTGRFPRNAGKLFIRCSNPAGCSGIKEAIYYHISPRCTCGHPFWISQRYMFFWPGDGTNMASVIDNERSKLGWNTKKLLGQIGLGFSGGKTVIQSQRITSSRSMYRLGSCALPKKKH